MEIKFKTPGDNPFTALLQLLDVKFTQSYSNQLYNEHPYKNNLLGFSKMLSEYGIKNIGIRVENKEQKIFELELPFIAYVGGDFVIVYKITNLKVYYIWNNKKIELAIETFCENWSGIALLVECTPISIEPDYGKHHVTEVYSYFQKSILCILISLSLIIFVYRSKVYGNQGMMILILLNLFGVYTGYLLVQKQVHIHSDYADRICSLFKKGDCNSVLESKASKLFGLIGWSEIGLSYFFSNLLLLCIAPTFINYFALINVCALPYSFWSVWYQKVKIKQWCPLCLIVQILLLSIFVVDICFGFLAPLNFAVRDILSLICIYGIPILFINIEVSILSKTRRTEYVSQEINSLKADKDVFTILLHKQPYYEVNSDTTHILFGNKNAEFGITILTNPHCAPCAKLHERVDKLLDEIGDKIYIQYVFTYYKYFKDKVEPSNMFLVESYFFYPMEKVKHIFGEWYRYGKNDREAFLEKYKFDANEELAIRELEGHYVWSDNYKLNATPLILINGYKLPVNYKIEDIKNIV